MEPERCQQCAAAGAEASDAWQWLCLRPGLPAELVEAILAHPDQRVRGGFADSWTAEPGDRARLAGDPEWRVRARLAAGPAPYRRELLPLPDTAYARLLADPEGRVREEAACSPDIPLGLLARYAGHKDPLVRAAVCRAWDSLAPAAREALLADPDDGVRRAAALRACAVEARYTDELVSAGVQLVDVLGHGMLSRSTAERLAASGDGAERCALAGNPYLPAELLARLAGDEDHLVRLAVSVRPELSEEQRARIDYQVLPRDRLHPLGWVLAGGESVVRQAAASAHIWLRRSAAVHPRLPSDLVEQLAEDEDDAVRLMLCEFQPSAPPGLLLRTALTAHALRAKGTIVSANCPRPGISWLTRPGQQGRPRRIRRQSL
ncbi:hypothetical protein V2J94_37790 [Streptomyces sp. DSM 41524]|uniref:LRV domain-containing protein n=1 Tax=Streptomyces asiaticus subsp. ignotus TaxID=3098222 RepID=A0ABU7Q877_9ACTN|nr:hypothetical protein [Streptomyces sp. DSM 41524]